MDPTSLSAGGDTCQSPRTWFMCIMANFPAIWCFGQNQGKISLVCGILDKIKVQPHFDTVVETLLAWSWCFTSEEIEQEVS